MNVGLAVLVTSDPPPFSHGVFASTQVSRMVWWEVPLRASVRKLIHFSTSIYFSKIEVRGVHNLRRRMGASPNGVIFAGNHPSGLVDPMVIMSALKHANISSVAKHSLFTAPGIKYFLQAFRAIPVAQPYDAALPESKQMSSQERKQMNLEMFTIVEQRLIQEGINIVIFPEGTCHSTPQIKQMRLGTARMALKIAAGPDSHRIPIIPVGISYSQPSGSEFRGKVLVDFGKPIEVTDAHLTKYTTGDRQEKLQVEEKLMRRVERHLRHVTIRTPNWCDSLLDIVKATELPTYTLHEGSAIQKRDTPIPSSLRHKLDTLLEDTSSSKAVQQQVSVQVGIDKFYSRIESESPTDARTRKQLQSTPAPSVPRRPPASLKRQAARAAFFQLQGIQQPPRDWEFLNAMHLARHIYKPEGVKLTLAQYASLTRNFTRVVLTNLSDPKVKELWQLLSSYQTNLLLMDVTDKFVRQFIAGDVDNDGTVSNDELLQLELSKLTNQPLLVLATNVCVVPFALVGSAIHLPVLMFSKYLGITSLSTTSDGGAPSNNPNFHDKDRSTQATMRMIGGLVGLAVLYPSIGVTAWLVGVHPLLAVAGSGLSGVAMLKSPPLSQLGQRFHAARRMQHHQSDSNNPNWLAQLRAQRETLQMGLRAYADSHAESDMQGWWKNPDLYVTTLKEQQREAERALLKQHQTVTEESIKEAELNQLSIPLAFNTRSPQERAVLTSKCLDGNHKAILWLPGRNDSFYHVHILDRLLATGFDVHALDLRRCGRAKYAEDGSEVTEELFAHDSFDFDEYNEEIDAALKYLKCSRSLTGGGIHGGCGKHYTKIVLYSHSTGSLVAAAYGTKTGAWRGAVDGFIFNSPFFDWNLPWYESIMAKKGINFVDPERIISTGGSASEYSTKLFNTYGYPTELKSIKELHVTAGWTSAVSKIQHQLVQGKLRIAKDKPALVLSTSADEVLNQESVIDKSKYLRAAENVHNITERRIGTSDVEESAHDVLAAPSALRVDEAMCHIESFLDLHFPTD